MTAEHEERAGQRLPALPVHGPGPAHGPDRLVVGGRVAHPLALTPEALVEMPRADVTEDFVCREGWCVPGVKWRGVALATLLAEAGAAADAAWVEVASGDFATSLTREQAESALIATHLDDQPLPREHGGPARLVVPGADCYTSIKWLDRVEVLTEPRPDLARDVALARLSRTR